MSTMPPPARPDAEASPLPIAPSTADTPLSPLPADWRSLPRAFMRAAREYWSAEAMSDSTGAKLTYGEALIRSLALGRVLGRTLGADESRVGLLIPPCVPGAVANLAVALRGKVSVNLNYSAGPGLIDAAIAKAGLKHVLTSQKVLAKLHLESRPEYLLLEDLAKRVTAVDKAWAVGVARVVPFGALGRFVPGLDGDKPGDLATIIFTSGSTGDPKGVMLSHANILSNVHQLNTHLQFLPKEVVLGILPFFHSFGYTVTIWTVLCLGKRVCYHANPLDARTVGTICEEQKVTMLVGTPTFMRSYLQRCRPEQFASIVHLLLGAEKLKPELFASIRSTLKVDPLEGYGCTELSPVVAVNVPLEKVTPDGRAVPGNRPGTVGMPLPGTAIRTFDPDTGAELPRGVEGMIRVAGPQVMLGYLDRPDATAAVLRDGWYETGDVGFLDADGFLHVTDRRGRFSKIGGEMVPHVRVEAAIVEAAGCPEEAVAVTSLPDPKRGERLAVIYTDMGMPPAEVHRRLLAGPLPKLWVPSAEDFVRADAIPILGTGKVDLRGVRDLAGARSKSPD